jgi:glycosyltransferase involved in cell wall biosynthesis
MRSAAFAATERFVEKLDTDGLRSPRVWFSQYVLGYRCWLIDNHEYARLPGLALALALARAVILYAFPALLDRPMALGMAGLPVLAVESPLAAQRMRDFIGLFSKKVPVVEVVAHPVDLGDLACPDNVERGPQVVAVGRWDAHQKDFPLLLRTLAAFLSVRSDWRATVVGRLPADFERLLSGVSPATRSRISFPGAIPHAELATHLYASRILLVTSRHESFHIAAAEALCCGCSVVGPVEIASMPWFVGSDSGTVSSRRSERFLAQALQVEARLWDAGARDPERIASVWRLRVGSRVIVERLLELLFPPDST